MWPCQPGGVGCYLHWVAQEVVVSRVFVELSVVEDVISLEVGVLSCGPLTHLLVKHILLGELVAHVNLARHLVRCRLFLTLVEGVLVIGVGWDSSEASHLGLSQGATTLSEHTSKLVRVGGFGGLGVADIVIAKELLIGVTYGLLKKFLRCSLHVYM